MDFRNRKRATNLARLPFLRPVMLIKVTVYLQMTNFLQISIFRLRNDPNEISKIKKSLKNITFWQGNGGFTFWSEVRATRLIDIFSAVFSNQGFHLKRTLQSPG